MASERDLSIVQITTDYLDRPTAKQKLLAQLVRMLSFPDTDELAADHFAFTVPLAGQSLPAFLQILDEARMHGQLTTRGRQMQQAPF